MSDTMQKNRQRMVVLLLLPVCVLLMGQFRRRVQLPPVEQDLELGEMTRRDIDSRPQEYPVLPEGGYPEAYQHIRRVLNNVLASPDIKYRSLFKYDDVKLIRDDQTLNAFATAGGYIYVYTGLIKYLEAEDHLAGVLGHEVAHAEQRHVTEQMYKKYGTRFGRLLRLGRRGRRPNDREMGRFILELRKLRFSRTQEAESDEYSVIYLASNPHYSCSGAAGFFEKLRNEGQTSRGVKWLSSHPDSESRIQAIHQKATQLGCSETLMNPASYRQFKASLP